MNEVWSRNTIPLHLQVHVNTELFWGILPLPVSQLSDDPIMLMGEKKIKNKIKQKKIFKKCTEKLTLKAVILTRSPGCSFRTAI